jgi:hypothetical protein
VLIFLCGGINNIFNHKINNYEIPGYPFSLYALCVHRCFGAFHHLKKVGYKQWWGKLAAYKISSNCGCKLFGFK